MIQNNCRMNEVFWGLGKNDNENWWKQVIDGRYHKFGSQVFDKGLHKGYVEPGFYKSIKNACEYASDQLGNSLTIECYQKIHQLACEHFINVPRRAINVDRDRINDFRDSVCNCSKNLTTRPYAYENEAQANQRILGFELLNKIERNLQFEHKIIIYTASKKEFEKVVTPEIKERIIKRFSMYDDEGVDVKDMLENGNSIYEQAIASKGKVNKQIHAIAKKFGLPMTLASVKLNEFGATVEVCVNYNYEDPQEIKIIIKKFINDYNKKIQNLNPEIGLRSPEENELALTHIAELFQNLEWLHPFFDGQGRTDLVLLAKLLTENGFNPCILYSPYFSTFEPLDDWIAYLKEGIENWKIEFNKVSL